MMELFSLLIPFIQFRLQRSGAFGRAKRGSRYDIGI